MQGLSPKQILSMRAGRTARSGGYAMRRTGAVKLAQG